MQGILIITRAVVKHMKSMLTSLIIGEFLEEGGNERGSTWVG